MWTTKASPTADTGSPVAACNTPELSMDTWPCGSRSTSKMVAGVAFMVRCTSIRSPSMASMLAQPGAAPSGDPRSLRNRATIYQPVASFAIENRDMIVQENPPTLGNHRPRVLWLVRHGETTWNSRGWVQGHVDGARLTRAGRRQVREAAAQLA